jgi:ferrous iron transport protein A
MLTYLLGIRLGRKIRGEAIMMPLTMAKTGDTATIRKITGKDEVRQHLAELGFVVDGTVTVVSEISGNLILQVKDSRIALDKTMANRIMI